MYRHGTKLKKPKQIVDSW